MPRFDPRRLVTSTPIHSGRHLAEQFDMLGMSAAGLARRLKVPTNRVTQILNGQRAVTGDTVLPLRRPAHAVSPSWAQSRPMIDLGSIAGLLEHAHELHAYCHSCNRWSVLPLASLVAEGRGSLRLPFTVRCRVCGEAGRLQVRPPMPLHPRAVGWMETAAG